MCILEIARSILRCSDAVAMRRRRHLVRTRRFDQSEYLEYGLHQIVRDGIPLLLHCIPTERIRFRECRFTVQKQDRSRELDTMTASVVDIP